MRPLFGLFRPRLALLNGVAATAGCLLHAGPIEAKTLLVAFFGVAFLAAGGSALNQVLERDLDRLMERTRERPLPRGDLAPRAATILGSGAILGGTALLAAFGDPLPALLGTAALAWYLAVYTPLKRRTSFALLVGALCGALPPVIGWCVAGGSPADYRAVLLAGLIYLWQVPHFWLLQRRHESDYRRAGLPLFGIDRDRASLTPFFRLWLVALIAGSALLPLFGIVAQHLAFWYLLFPLPLIVIARLRHESALFSYLNLFPVMVTAILLVQR